MHYKTSNKLAMTVDLVVVVIVLINQVFLFHCITFHRLVQDTLPSSLADAINCYVFWIHNNNICDVSIYIHVNKIM